MKLDAEVKSIAVGTVNGLTGAVSGSDDGSIRLWDVASGAVRLLGSHQTTVSAMTIGAVRNKVLANSGSEDGIVRTWDLTNPSPLATCSATPCTAPSRPSPPARSRARRWRSPVATTTSSGSGISAPAGPYGNGLSGPEKGSESLAIGVVDGRALVVSGHWDGAIWAWSL